MAFRTGRLGLTAAMLAGAFGVSPAAAGPAVTVNFTDAATFVSGTCIGADCSGTDGTDGNQRIFTFLDGDGLMSRVRVTAWSADQSTSGGTAGQLSNFQNGYAGLYTGGLGVTNRNEGDGASNALHTTDNNGKVDYLVFHFDGDVTATRAELNSFVMSVSGFADGTDTDASFYVGTVAAPWATTIDLASAAQRLTVLDNHLDTLGASSSSQQSGVLRNFNNAAGQMLVKGNTLVVAASIGDYLRGTANGNRRDNFKLESVKIQYAVPIPAPAALGLLGLGALAIGIRRRQA